MTLQIWCLFSQLFKIKINHDHQAKVVLAVLDINEQAFMFNMYKCLFIDICCVWLHQLTKDNNKCLYNCHIAIVSLFQLSMFLRIEMISTNRSIFL